MSKIRGDFLRSLEAGIVGLVLVQAVRFLYATLYARASSADLVQRVPDPAVLQNVPGVAEISTVQGELLVMIGMLTLPVLALIIGRWGVSFPFAVLLVALGRSTALQTADLEIPGSALAVGAALLYLALTVIRRPANFPTMILLGFTGDQLIRAYWDTYDRSWQSNYRLNVNSQFEIEIATVVSIMAIALILLSILVWYLEYREAQAQRREEGYAPPLRGQFNLWAGLALGGIFFLEFTVLGLPNAVARWSATDYTGIVPWLLAATALPLVPEVREIARRFAGMFDTAWRGMLWLLLLGLLLVVGRRYDGLPAGIALVTAQFLVGLTLWWLIQTGLPRRNLTGVTVIISVIAFAALAVGDYFTYDYAYVRDLSEPYQNVSVLLRSFRGTGLGLTLVATLLLSIPMILARGRIPWRGGQTLHTFFGLVIVIGASFGGTTVAVDHIVKPPANPDCLRVATFNIHGGYSQFFDPNLERVAQLIELNGSDVVLLQEVDTGRLASFGVDQALWLARRLNMEAAFYPQNEALQGLAVLSRVPIVDTFGFDLPSDGNQAAAMRVILDPERLTADPLAPQLGNLNIYNAWLGFRVVERDGQPIPENEQDQTRQLDALLSRISAWHAPAWTDRIIIGGTFNFGEDDPNFQRFDITGIKDPFAGLRVEERKTVFLVDGAAARYDYLWTFNLPLNGASIDLSPEASLASDHRSATVAVARRTGITCAP